MSIGPQGYRFFHAKVSMKFQMLMKGKMLKIKDCSCFDTNLPINVKMPTTVSIFVFISRINLMLS